ncbi:MAG: helix-turn-helix domain-containing protein [Proteobacteria bacterium]|nr:helix-turn-helix domain-containing protein [Pseudomonadota bacterium]
MSPRKREPESHRFSYQGLERVIHERARLSILASLLAHSKGLAFGELLELCDLTDGNLSRHLQVLQAARLITVSRDSGPGRPQTVCRITPSGRRRFLGYLAVLERVLHDAANALGTDHGAPTSL